MKGLRVSKKFFVRHFFVRQRAAARVHRGAVACRRGAFARGKACSLPGIRSSLQAGTTAAGTSAEAAAAAATGTAAGRAAVPVGHRSVTRPVPAHSRTAAIHAARACLSWYGPETATTAPSGARSRNRKSESASTNASNFPAMTILPWAPGGTNESGRAADNLTRPIALSLCKLLSTRYKTSGRPPVEGACRRRGPALDGRVSR